MKIDYDNLEDEYGDLPEKESVRPSTKMRDASNFTNTMKMAEANRNGAIRRYRKLSEKLRNYN